MYLTGWFKIIAAVDGEKGDNAFVVDVDDEMIPVAVINDGKAYGQEQVVTVSAYYGIQPVPVGDLEITVIPSNESRFTATLEGDKVRIKVVQGAGWTDVKKETVTISVKSRYGERNAVVSLYPTFPGKDSCIYSLFTSKSSLTFARDDKNVVIGTESIEFKIRRHVGTSLTYVDYNPVKNGLHVYYSYDDSTYTPFKNVLTLQVGASDASKYRYLFVELWEGERNSGTIQDKESIPLLTNGKKGDKGDKGDDGTSVTILSPSYNTLDELLQAHPKGNSGDAYLVNGELYVWNGQAWENVGKIQGPAGDSTYIHIAYANSPDGHKDFSVIDSNRSHFGIFASTTENVGDKWLPDYKWTFVKGEPGNDGNSVIDVINFYQKSSSNVNAPDTKTTIWLEKAPPLDSVYKYLWNFERSMLSRGGYIDTLPKVVAYYSEDGRGILRIEEEYGLSHYSTVQPTVWTPSIPAMDAYNKYLWNRERIIYTKGDPDPVEAHIVGTYGDKGEPGARGAAGKDAPVPNPNLLNATSFKAIGKHDDKWNVRITTEWKNKYELDVHDGRADFRDLEGGVFNTKYLHAMVSDGVENKYVDLVQQNIILDSKNRKVRKDNWYTLSFWSKGEIVVYVYSTENPQTRVIEQGVYVDGKFLNVGTDGRITVSNDVSKEFHLHTFTFRTTETDFTSHILFRMFTSHDKYPPQVSELSVDLCCIKLEEGKEATPWCRSERDIRGARPDQKIWQEGKYYYMGEDGEDTYTIVEYGVESNGDPQYYVCKKTLDVPSKLGENDPVTSIQNHLGIWDYAPKDELGLFGRIASSRIDTKTLVTQRFYSISEDGSRSVKIENGIQEFSGRNGIPNIKIGLDENGCSMLEFYDENGVFKYGLGPSQIGFTKNRQQRWDVVSMKLLGSNLSEVVKKGQWKAQNILGENYYEYTSAIVTNVNQDPSNDQCTFTKQQTNGDSVKISGIYTMSGPCRIHGSYDLPNIHEDNHPVMSGEMYVRELLTYFNGKLTSRQPVYWSSREMEYGNIITNK